jgi:LexA DNA binding domain
MNQRFEPRLVPPRSRFTQNQGQYLAFILAYTLVLGRPPAHAHLLRYFRVTPPSVNQMLITLEREGFIRRQPGVARSINRSSIPNLCHGYSRLQANRSKPLCSGPLSARGIARTFQADPWRMAWR